MLVEALQTTDREASLSTGLLCRTFPEPRFDRSLAPSQQQREISRGLAIPQPKNFSFLVGSPRFHSIANGSGRIVHCQTVRNRKN